MNPEENETVVRLKGIAAKLPPITSPSDLDFVRQTILDQYNELKDSGKMHWQAFALFALAAVGLGAALVYAEHALGVLRWWAVPLNAVVIFFTVGPLYGFVHKRLSQGLADNFMVQAMTLAMTLLMMKLAETGAGTPMYPGPGVAHATQSVTTFH